MKVTVIYQILLASLLLVGCTKVDLCDETTHPHVVDGFSVTYNWNELGLSADEMPEKLYFVATRILNTRHIVYQTDKDGNFKVEKSKEETATTLMTEILRLRMMVQPLAITLTPQVPMTSPNLRVSISLISSCLEVNM